MIVRKLDNGRLLCIPQTTHALMAAQFCRFWGNADFLPPHPYTPVLMAIAQHDNGWYEWEQRPRLRSEGVPMDFINFTDQAEKTQLWQRGIERAWAQHPYAAVLISRHASLLYERFQAQDAYNEINNQAVTRFLADQKQLMEKVHRVLGGDQHYGSALQSEAIEANTRLLQFGDRASLQVSVPWANESAIYDCPVDYTGNYTSLKMCYDERHITFDPWPYGVDEFEVSLEGYLLEQECFSSEEVYHRALAKATFYRRSWIVRHET